jgi:hypothetical protein
MGYAISSNSTVEFMIGDAPSILSISLDNKTYDSSSVPLNVITDQPIKQATYSLDNQASVIFDGNTTLKNLANGFHNITVSCIAVNGTEGFPKTINFAVDADTPSLNFIFLAIVVIIVSISTALLIYRRRQRPGQVT